MRNPEASDFCYYPFFQILVTAEGKYKPCSKHDDHIVHGGKTLTTSNATFEEAWNSDYMKQMRSDFMNGVKFPGCAECWRQQKMGLKSMRYHSYQYNISESQVENPQKPMRIEINASNVCNLRCRICTPTASTKWIPEAREIYGWNEKTHLNLRSDNLQQAKQWADNLTEICFFGGEPLLSEENLKLLDFLIEQGYSKNIAVLFNTNGTVFNDSIDGRLRKFKGVRMYFSIDGIGKHFEYQRSGAKWSEVEENLKKAYLLSKTSEWKHIQFKICHTVSSFNIYYFPEFFEYFNTHFPGLMAASILNFLYDPWEFSVQILPEKIKKNISGRLRNITTTHKLNEFDLQTITSLDTYLNSKVDKPFSEFFRFVNRHDVYRHESFPEVFPELWNEISEYKPEDLTMGVNDSYDAVQQRMIRTLSSYKDLSLLEDLRNNPDFNFEDETRLASAKQLAIGALREISLQLKKDGNFENKLNRLETLLGEEHLNSKDFIRDLFVFGPFRFYKSISELDEDMLADFLIRKFPVSMADKYV